VTARAVFDFLTGIVLLIVGLGLLYVVFGGAFMTRFMPAGRPSTYDLVVGVLVWALALTAPVTFLVVGVARLAKAYRRWHSPV
jgi:threonine/homoserine/homoserine lactone efflux protein